MHCRLPHPRSTTSCPTTGKAIAPTKRLSRRAPAFDAQLPRFPVSAPTTDESTLPRFPGSAPSGQNSTAEHSTDSLLSSSGPQVRAVDARAAAIKLGDLLEGRYEVLRHLGSGAMGDVFECHERLIGRRVAVKVLNPATAANAVLMQRFRREARIAGALGHQNVCRIYSIGQTNRGMPFLVMELLRGESLAVRLLRGPLSFDVTLQIAHQILSALTAAHAVGIVHRDIKPANVFLVSSTSAPMVKLIDFGISKASTERTQLTRIGHVVGTPAYMAPEQTRGVGVDHRVDIYSTGVVMYECLTGERPFEARNFEEILEKVCRGLFPSIRLLRPDVPPVLEHLVLHAMQLSPDKRPASAAEMASDITAVLSELAPPVSSAPHSKMMEDDDPTLVGKPSFD